VLKFVYKSTEDEEETHSGVSILPIYWIVFYDTLRKLTQSISRASHG